MTINVLLFAAARELAGAETVAVELAPARPWPTCAWNWLGACQMWRACSPGPRSR